MSQNPIQFQRGMSLSEVIDTFSTEAKWEAALVRACPRNAPRPEKWLRLAEVTAS